MSQKCKEGIIEDENENAYWSTRTLLNIARYLEHNGDKEMEDASVEEERGPDAVELVGNVAQPEREEAAHVIHARNLVGVV